MKQNTKKESTILVYFFAKSNCSSSLLYLLL